MVSIAQIIFGTILLHFAIIQANPINDFKFKSPKQLQQFKFKSPKELQRFKSPEEKQIPESTNEFKFKSPKELENFKFKSPKALESFKFKAPKELQNFKFKSPKALDGFKFKSPKELQQFKFKSPKDLERFKSPEEKQILKSPKVLESFKFKSPKELENVLEGLQKVSVLSAQKGNVAVTNKQADAQKYRKWIPPLVRKLQQAREVQEKQQEIECTGDCMRVYNALTECINRLPAIMEEQDIDDSFKMLESLGLDINDDADRQTISNFIVLFAELDLLSTMGKDEKQQFEQSMKLFTQGVEEIKVHLKNEIEGTPQYKAMESVVELYDVLDSIGFIPH